MKKHRVLISIALILIIVIGATLFSYLKFSVINPFSSCLGILDILCTDKKLTEVQNYPQRVIFSKTSDYGDDINPEQLLDEYMSKRGFTYFPNERLGGIVAYTNGTVIERVELSVNQYYSKWIWEKEVKKVEKIIL